MHWYGEVPGNVLVFNTPGDVMVTINNHDVEPTFWQKAALFAILKIFHSTSKRTRTFWFVKKSTYLL